MGLVSEAEDSGKQEWEEYTPSRPKVKGIPQKIYFTELPRKKEVTRTRKICREMFKVRQRTAEKPFETGTDTNEFREIKPFDEYPLVLTASRSLFEVRKEPNS